MGITVTLFAFPKADIDHSKTVERQLRVAYQIECGKRFMNLLNINPETEEGTVGEFFTWSDSTNVAVLAIAANIHKIYTHMSMDEVDGHLVQFDRSLLIDALGLFSRALKLVVCGEHFVALRWA